MDEKEEKRVDKKEAEGKDEGGEEDYGSSVYWEQRYAAGRSWEWYYSCEDLLPLIEKSRIEKSAEMLEVGCGDSPLAWGLRKAGFGGRMCCFDVSQAVISGLNVEKDRTRAADKTLTFEVMDARKLDFDSSTFDVVFEKGTMDAMLCGSGSKADVVKVFQEVGRVLRAPGWLVLVSHMSPHGEQGMSVLSEVVMEGLQSGSSTAANWRVDIHSGRAPEEEGEGEPDDAVPSVYVVQKLPRKQTRAVEQGEQGRVVVSLHSYD